jgi:hypothetical protein
MTLEEQTALKIISCLRGEFTEQQKSDLKEQIIRNIGDKLKLPPLELHSYFIQGLVDDINSYVK